MRLVNPSRRWLLTSMTLVACTLALTGCFENFDSGPVSVRAEGSYLMVAVCTNVEVKEIFAYDRNSSRGVKWSEFWDATGSTPLVKGQFLSMKAGVSGLSTTNKRAPLLVSGTDIEVTLVGVKAEEGFASSFVVGDKGLSQTRWLQVGGKETVDPCPAR